MKEVFIDVHDFMKIHGLSLDIKRRPMTTEHKLYYARFKQPMVVDNVFAYGNGNTRRSAVQDFIKKIRNKNIELNPSLSRIIKVPKGLRLLTMKPL